MKTSLADGAEMLNRADWFRRPASKRDCKSWAALHTALIRASRVRRCLGDAALDVLADYDDPTARGGS